MPPTSHQPPAFADDLAGYIDAEVSLGGETVGVDTDLVLSGLVDSLGVVRIVGWIEHRLGIDIDPADVVIEHFGSVSSVVAYLQDRSDVHLR